jgi:hypothetical protein
MLQFLDDGHGMDPEECSHSLILGVSNKKETKNMEHIGKYGNGLKSYEIFFISFFFYSKISIQFISINRSTLRIANDFILFTKKNNILSISFLSCTFHDEEGINKTDVSLNFSFFCLLNSTICIGLYCCSKFLR